MLENLVDFFSKKIQIGITREIRVDAGVGTTKKMGIKVRKTGLAKSKETNSEIFDKMYKQIQGDFENEIIQEVFKKYNFEDKDISKEVQKSYLKVANKKIRNRKSTILSKGHSRAGVDTGQLLASLGGQIGD